MSRWHLTSSEMLHAKANDICDTAGLERHGTVDGQMLHLSTYMKRSVRNRNFLRIDDDTWITAVGTLIYEGCMGEEA